MAFAHDLDPQLVKKTSSIGTTRLRETGSPHILAGRLQSLGLQLLQPEAVRLSCSRSWPGTPPSALARRDESRSSPPGRTPTVQRPKKSFSWLFRPPDLQSHLPSSLSLALLALEPASSASSFITRLDANRDRYGRSGARNGCKCPFQLKRSANSPLPLVQTQSPHPQRLCACWASPPPGSAA